MSTKAVATPSSAPPAAERVLTVVAHPWPLLRSGIVGVLTDLDECDPVVSVLTLSEVATAIAPDSPGLLVCSSDLCGPDLADLAVLRQRRPRLITVIVMAATEARLEIPAALGLGVRAVLEAGVTPEDLASAVRGALAGRVSLAPGLSIVPDAEVVPSVTLTRRERQVLDLMSRGWGNRAIAAELFISENTVHNHVRRVHEKLGVRTRTEAVVRAAREGLVEITGQEG